MDNPNPSQQKEFPLEIDGETEQQYSLHSNLLQQFISISSIDKSWIFNSNSNTNPFPNFNFILFCYFYGYSRFFITRNDGIFCLLEFDPIHFA